MIELKQAVLNTLLLLGLFLLMSQGAFAEKEKPVVKLTPKIKVQDRDSRWFARLSCNQLQNIKPNSKKEEDLLAQRKKQCIKGFSAFY